MGPIRFISLFFLAAIFACSKDRPVEDCELNLNPKDRYIFPLVPGMPEWAKLSGGDEMLEVTQVPVKRVRSMSTDGLILTYMDWPLAFGTNYVNHIPNAIAFQIKHFNPLGELVNRRDAGCKLLARYRAHDIHAWPTASLRGDSAMAHKMFLNDYVISFITCHFDFLEKMSGVQHRDLVQMALKRHFDKQLYPQFYSIAYEDLWVTMRVMYFNRYPAFMALYESDELIWEFTEFGTGMLRFESYTGPKWQGIIQAAYDFVESK